VSHTSTWVLMANDGGALICANTSGVSVPIQCFSNLSLAGEAMSDMRHAFASMLMLTLCRGAIAHAYTNLVIVADKPMLDELRLLRTSQVARCLVAEIESVPEAMPELGHGDCAAVTSH
jgi:Protein required for attachment to host cells